MALQYYENVQFEDIKIPNHCILEIYKDNLNAENGIGYYIMPIESGLSKDEIENKIRTTIQNSAPQGYSNLAILSGNEYNTYLSRIVYCVWYLGDIAPLYPEEPVIGELSPVADEINIWEQFVVNNTGARSALAEIELDVVNNGDSVELYINDDLFYINLNTELLNFQLKINNNGVFINNAPYDDFKISGAPVLKPGINTVSIKKTNTTNISITYTPEY